MGKLPPICNLNPQFKGWTKPGPRVELPESLELEEGISLDALCGHFRIFQLRDGHRFSTDDLLTAWYGTSWAPSVQRALDLGSGIGTVAMVMAWRLRGAQIWSVEAQEVSVELARRSIAYNDLQEQITPLFGDLRDAALLDPDLRFDLITGTPPYWPPEEGTVSEHPQRAACRFELRGDIRDYCQSATARLAPGGLFAAVFPIAQLERVQQAAREAELVILRRRTVALREDNPLLSLFAMVRAQDLPAPMRERCWVEPTLVIRQLDGELSPEYCAIKMSFGFPPL